MWQPAKRTADAHLAVQEACGKSVQVERCLLTGLPTVAILTPPLNRYSLYLSAYFLIEETHINKLHLLRLSLSVILHLKLPKVCVTKGDVTPGTTQGRSHDDGYALPKKSATRVNFKGL
jgi:hypothetical protein